MSLTNGIFGRLTAKKCLGRDARRRVWWECECSCGAIKKAREDHLRSGNTRSCGCLHRDAIKTHGLSKSPLNKIWYAMRSRCLDPLNEMFPAYGGRGITVCDEWAEFERFHGDMSGSYLPGLQLDRVDNSRGYCKENCRWATPSDNCKNTRRNRMVKTPSGETLCLLDAATKYGADYSLVISRLNRGWPPSKALLTPPLKTWSRKKVKPAEPV